jgi:hypothetical protein
MSEPADPPRACRTAVRPSRYAYVALQADEEGAKKKTCGNTAATGTNVVAVEGYARRSLRASCLFLRTIWMTHGGRSLGLLALVIRDNAGRKILSAMRPSNEGSFVVGVCPLPNLDTFAAEKETP